MTQVGQTTNDRHEAKLQADLKVIAVTVQQIAQTHQGDLLALLGLLRILEALHQEIRDGLFQEVLPTNRQALYSLLRDIEAGGGWPYIPRMKLQALLAALQLEDLRDDRD